MDNEELIEGLTARFTVEFKSGAGISLPYRELTHIAEEAQTYFDPVAEKTYIVWGEGEAELVPDDGEVKDANMQTFYIEVTGAKFSRKVSCELSALRNRLKQELLAGQVRKLGGGAEQARARRAMTMLLRGDTMEFGACYDGQALFSTSHAGADSELNPINNQSNLFALALTEDNLAEVIRVLSTLRNSAGENFGNKWTANVQADGSPAPSFTLYHGPKLAKTVAKLLQQSRGAEQSVLAGTFRAVQLDELEGPYEDYWFVVFDTGKPLAMIDHGDIVIATVGHETEPGRNHGKAEWTARAVFGQAYYEWHCIAMSKGGA